MTHNETRISNELLAGRLTGLAGIAIGAEDGFTRLNGPARALIEAAAEALRGTLVQNEAVEGHTPQELIVMGWEACRRSIYAVCEDVSEKPFADASKTGPLRGLGPTPAQEAHSRGFNAGWSHAGKSIARGFTSMEALDDDNVRAVLARAAAPQPSSTDSAVKL